MIYRLALVLSYCLYNNSNTYELFLPPFWNPFLLMSAQTQLPTASRRQFHDLLIDAIKFILRKFLPNYRTLKARENSKRHGSEKHRCEQPRHRWTSVHRSRNRSCFFFFSTALREDWLDKLAPVKDRILTNRLQTVCTRVHTQTQASL